MSPCSGSQFHKKIYLDYSKANDQEKLDGLKNDFNKWIGKTPKSLIHINDLSNNDNSVDAEIAKLFGLDISKYTLNKLFENLNKISRASL